MTTAAKDVDRVVDAVILCTAPITQILDHMAHAPEPPSPHRATELIRELLRDALAPLLTSTPTKDLRRSARLLNEVADLIEAGIFLVPHPPQAPHIRPPRGCRGRR